MSSFVAAKLQHYKRALLIGQETGGGATGSSAVLTYNLTLPNSKVRVKVPYYFLDHKTDVQIEGSGVIPDKKISYRISDRVKQLDLEMEAALNLIQSKS